MYNRCDKHKIFIGKNGCKICNEIKRIKAVSDFNYSIYIQEIKKVNDLNKENSELKEGIKAINTVLAGEIDDKKDLYKEREQLFEQIEQLKSNTVPESVKFAIKYLTRNEMFLVKNLLGAQSIIAAIVDKIVATPDSKKQVLKPLFDYTMSICEKTDLLNDELAPTAINVLGVKKYEDNLLDVANVCDFLAGKIKKCETCTAWLDNKAINRKVMRDEVNAR